MYKVQVKFDNCMPRKTYTSVNNKNTMSWWAPDQQPIVDTSQITGECFHPSHLILVITLYIFVEICFLTTLKTKTMSLLSFTFWMYIYMYSVS